MIYFVTFYQPTFLRAHFIIATVDPLRYHNAFKSTSCKYLIKQQVVILSFKFKFNGGVLPRHYNLMQETRKIVMAELQNIVYREWLPAFLSPQTLQKFNLGLQPDSQYHPSVNPSIRNEFSTAAYRYFHSYISSSHKKTGPDCSACERWLIFKSFFQVWP